MGAALALSERGRARTYPNPSVGCIIVNENRAVGRGWTQPAGRPHAEAMAVVEAGAAALGATAYVTLEPCAAPGRGPACTEVLIEAGVARVVVGVGDPFPAVNGRGFARLREAGITVVDGVRTEDAERAMAGFLTRQRHGRPHVTLKLATSLDGCIALASGQSRWITSDAARRHAHLERARHEAILVGRGTWEADAPKLDVRLAGLEARSPVRYVLSATGDVSSPAAIGALPHNSLLIEGGAQTAASFVHADLVDRLLLYTAPVLIGGGKAALGDVGLTDLTTAHGRWRRTDSRVLGVDRLDVYERTRCSPA